MTMDPDLEQALAARGYRPARALKDDFVSEVWRLEGPEGSALLKRSRGGRLLLGLPPRLLTARELAMLRALEGLPGIPRVYERLDATTYVREFVEGRSLRECTEVPADFFPRLLELLAAVHARGVACVDLSKRENILVAAGGGPALMDFQAGWRLRPGSWAGWLFGPLLRTLQRGDRYHVYKHQRRRFPTAPIPPAPADLRSTPWGVRLHGWLLRKPYLAIKRLFDGKAHA